MGCNCGGGATGRVAGGNILGFEVTLPSGEVMPMFLTEAEANAEIRRRGGGTLRTVPR